MAIQSVMIDQREPDWVQKLEFSGVPKAVTLLNAGDFLLATDDNCMLAIERKTPGDLLNTLRGDRLFQQVAALREVSPWSYLLITGPLLRGPDNKVIADRITGWDWNAVQGALLTVQELGVHVLHCAGDHDLETALIRLANRSRDAVPVDHPRRSRILSDAESIIAALPGIGLERLDAIERVFPINQLGYMGLLALTDPEPEKWDIQGIGSGITRRIRKALGLQDGMYLQLTKGSTNEQRTDDQKAA
jgi:ERCC4-type nuclease